MPERAAHYFDAAPDVRSDPAVVQLSLPDVELALITDRGVFSASRVDPGTYALLRHGPPPPQSGAVLDLGCGYGPIALAVAAQAPAARVWAVDVNARALDLTRRNADSHGLRNVVVSRPDDVDPDVRFSAIYSNPPIRVGKAALHAMLERWLSRLASNGRAYLVIHRHLGSDSLAMWLGAQGWPTTRVASRNGYRLLEVKPTEREAG